MTGPMGDGTERAFEIVAPSPESGPVVETRRRGIRSLFGARFSLAARWTHDYLPALLLSFGAMVVVTLVQYARYGTERFLGWDTPFYVYQTTVIDQLGLGPALQSWH